MLNKTHYTGYISLQYKKAAIKLCDTDSSLVLLNLWEVSKQSWWISASVWSVTKVARKSRKLSDKGLHWRDGTCGGAGALRGRWQWAVGDLSLQLIHSFLQLGTFGKQILVALVKRFLETERKKKYDTSEQMFYTPRPEGTGCSSPGVSYEGSSGCSSRPRAPGDVSWPQGTAHGWNSLHTKDW